MNTTRHGINKGVIYFVTGNLRYLKECVFSAKSLKKHCPDIPITLFTDRTDIKKNFFDEIELRLLFVSIPVAASRAI